MVDKSAESARMGVEVLTAWLASPDWADDFLNERLDAILEAADTPDSALQLALGLISVSGFLLRRRESEVGISSEDSLRELGRAFARE